MNTTSILLESVYIHLDFITFIKFIVKIINDFVLIKMYYELLSCIVNI